MLSWLGRFGLAVLAAAAWWFAGLIVWGTCMDIDVLQALVEAFFIGTLPAVFLLTLFRWTR